MQRIDQPTAVRPIAAGMLACWLGGVVFLCIAVAPARSEDAAAGSGDVPSAVLHAQQQRIDVIQRASAAAVALGACVFEKHFTLDRDLPGPDHWFSEDPASLHEWVSAVRSAYQMLGSGIVEPTKTESENKKEFLISILVLIWVLISISAPQLFLQIFLHS